MVRIVRKGHKEYELKFTSQNWEAARQTCTGSPSDEEVQGAYLVLSARCRNDHVLRAANVCLLPVVLRIVTVMQQALSHMLVSQPQVCIRCLVLYAGTDTSPVPHLATEDVWSAGKALHRQRRETHGSLALLP